MPEPLDQAALDDLRAMVGDDPALYAEVLGAFLADADQYLSELETAPDSAVLRRGAHSLKSNAMNVGATSLAELCQALETDSTAGSVPDAPARVDAIRRELATVREAVGREREGAGHAD